MKNNFEDTQRAELESWISKDPTVNRDKQIRETIRYPLLKKQMGLDSLDSSNMIVYDIGPGMFGGVSTILNCKKVVRVDPLMDEYIKYYPQQGGLTKKAEEVDYGEADLVIATNSIDHFENPEAFFIQLKKTMKPGAFFASLHAINNSYTHKHEAHAHSITPELVHQYLDSDFETVWALTYPEIRYGWHEYMGKVGQPAFSLLMRKVTGYG